MQPFAAPGTLNLTMSVEPLSISDRVLADRILMTGDETAFRTLYARHTPRLFQLVLRIVGGCEHDAEDVVQEAWVRATTALAGFRWESAFATWLSGIGINCARGALRRTGRWTTLDEAAEPWIPPPATGERIDLERALALLPAGYRAVLLLHDVEGYTHEEIAGRLEIAAGTSKSQLFHARRALRRMLEPVTEGATHEHA
jgi:RNA polymerase sigma factor (sigma-70 family)